ncbi:Hypothetical protein HVR_LOCUS252 [uncultured virus]|nr:Hypothetical protein HVR_LOCUS252 [uncultured virus]
MDEKILKEIRSLDSMIYLLIKTKLRETINGADICVKYRIYLNDESPFVGMKLNQRMLEQWGWGNVERLYPTDEDVNRDKTRFDLLIYQFARQKVDLMKQHFFHDLEINKDYGVRVTYQAWNPVLLDSSCDLRSQAFTNNKEALLTSADFNQTSFSDWKLKTGTQLSLKDK